MEIFINSVLTGGLIVGLTLSITLLVYLGKDLLGVYWFEDPSGLDDQ